MVNEKDDKDKNVNENYFWMNFKIPLDDKV